MEKFIDLVKSNPALYDYSHEDYSSKDTRLKIWQKITKEMGFSDEKYSRAEWKRLRDTYRSTLKSGGVKKNGKIWRYTKRMNFLAPFMNYNKENMVSENVAESPSSFAYYDHMLVPSMDEGYPSMTDSFDSDSKRLKLDISNMTSLDHFFMSMCETTKSLPVNLQTQIKRKLFQVVTETEEIFEQAKGEDWSKLCISTLSSSVVESSTNVQKKDST